MKLLGSLIIAALAVNATPLMAHTGPAALDQHLFEHIIIALAVGIPLAYGLFKYLKRTH